MEDSPDRPRHQAIKPLLTTAAVVVGIASGALGMWISLQSLAEKKQAAFEERITAQVKKDMEIQNHLTRLDERYEALKATVWANQANGR